MTEQPDTPTPPDTGSSIANGIGAAIVFTIGITTLIAVICAAIWTTRHLIAWALA